MEKHQTTSSKKTKKEEEINEYLYEVEEKGNKIYIKFTNTKTLEIKVKSVDKENMSFDQVLESISRHFSRKKL